MAVKCRVPFHLFLMAFSYDTVVLVYFIGKLLSVTTIKCSGKVAQSWLQGQESLNFLEESKDTRVRAENIIASANRCDVTFLRVRQLSRDLADFVRFPIPKKNRRLLVV